MIGQEYLLKKLNNYTLETLPKSLLLVGDKGCGKHTIVKELAEKHNLDIIDISNSITNEDIIEYQRDVYPKIYTIDVSLFNIKQQSQLLKLVEEPSKYMYIILLAETENNIITPLLNRCIKFYFKPYSIEELKQIKYFDNDVVYAVCKTPGLLQDVNQSSFDKILTLCNDICKKIYKATYANTLSLSVKKDTDFNYNLFFNMMTYISKNIYSKETDKKLAKILFNIYTITNSYKQKLSIPAINKEILFLSYLDTLYYNSRYEN